MQSVEEEEEEEEEEEAAIIVIRFFHQYQLDPRQLEEGPTTMLVIVQ